MASTLFLACSSAPRRERSIDQIVASVPDSAMRERWRDAEAKGQLPDPRTLPAFDQPVTTRKPAVMTGTAKLGQGPLIPAQSVADVRVVGLDTLSSYRGPVAVRDTSAGRLRGVLSTGAGIEIHFKLPGNQRLAFVPGELRLAYQQNVDNNSLRRELLLTAGTTPVLFYLSDGSARPYSRTMQELGLQLRQTGEVQQRVSPIELTYANERFVLRPGDRRRVGEVEFFVLSSYYLRPEEIETAEGDPYHVTLMMYRPR